MASSARPSDGLRELAHGAGQELEQESDWSIENRHLEHPTLCPGCEERTAGVTGYCPRCTRDATDGVCGDGTQ